MKITNPNSKNLKAADLNGREVRVVMDRVELQDFQNRKTGALERKYVLYFEGKEKGLVLNKTNLNTIVDYYGDESDHWAGQPVILYETTVEFEGKRTPTIRIKVNPNHTARGQVAAPQQPPARSAPQQQSRYADKEIEEDSIPF